MKRCAHPMLAALTALLLTPTMGQTPESASPENSPAGEESLAHLEGIEPEAFLAQLREREAALDQREQTLRNREESLRTLHAEVEARIADLELIRQRINQQLEQIDRNRETRISALAEMYEGMDPEAAAAQLTELETGTIIDILMMMERDAAAYVLEQVEPAKAAEVIGQMSRRE